MDERRRMKQCSAIRYLGLGLGFFRRFLWRLVESFRPRRHDAVHARVSNRLAEVFAKVTGNGDEGATQRGPAVEHFLWLVRIFLFECNDGIAEMRKGVFQGQYHFGLVRGEGHDGLEIEASRRSGSEGPGDTVVGAGDMRKDFSHRAHPSAGRQVYFSAGMVSARLVYRFS